MYEPSELVAVGFALPLLSVVAVILRFLARRAGKDTRVAIDDWFILIALLFVVAMGVAQLYGTLDGGLGRPTTLDAQGHPVLDSMTRAVLKAQYVSQTTEKIAYGFIKMGVILFYRRIFQTQKFGLACIIMLAITAAWTISYFIVTVAACGSNISLIWTYTSIKVLHSQCVQTVDVLLSYNVTDIVLDVIILSMPLPMIWKLNMTPNRKLAISAIFLLGILSTAASAVRLGIGIYTINHVYKTSNMSGVITPPMYWSLIGACIALVAACLPTFGPLFQVVWGYGTAKATNYSNPMGGYQGHSTAKRLRSRSDSATESTLRFKDATSSWDAANFEGVREVHAMGKMPGRDQEGRDLNGIIVEREISVTHNGRLAS